MCLRGWRSIKVSSFHALGSAKPKARLGRSAIFACHFSCRIKAGVCDDHDDILLLETI